MLGVPSSVHISTVEADLILGFHAAQRVEDFAINGGDRLFDALAAIALSAVAQLDRLMCARRRTGRHRSTAERAVFQPNIDFHRGIAAAIENFAAGNVDNGGHADSVV